MSKMLMNPLVYVWPPGKNLSELLVGEDWVLILFWLPAIQESITSIAWQILGTQ